MFMRRCHLSVTLLMALSSCWITEGFASNASLSAQGIPVGLIPDHASLSRFPSSALDLDPGIMGDMEAGSRQLYSVLYRWGKTRLALDWGRDPDRLDGHTDAVQCLMAIPWGSIRLGAVVGGWVRHDDSENHDTYQETLNDADRNHQRAGLGVGIPLGGRSHLELALHLTVNRSEARNEYWRREYNAWEIGDWELNSLLVESANSCMSHRSEVRVKIDAGDDADIWALLSYDVAALSRDVTYETQSAVQKLEDVRNKSQSFGAVLAVERSGFHASVITIGLSVHYQDDLHSIVRTSAGLSFDTQRDYRTRVASFAGLGLRLHRRFHLYAGVQGGFDRTISERGWGNDTRSTAQDRYYLYDAMSAGFGCRFRTFRLDAQVNNDLTMEDPFALVSLSYSF